MFRVPIVDYLRMVYTHNTCNTHKIAKNSQKGVTHKSVLAKVPFFFLFSLQLHLTTQKRSKCSPLFKHKNNAKMAQLYNHPAFHTYIKIYPSQIKFSTVHCGCFPVVDYIFINVYACNM